MGKYINAGVIFTADKQTTGENSCFRGKLRLSDEMVAKLRKEIIAGTKEIDLTAWVNTSPKGVKTLGLTVQEEEFVPQKGKYTEEKVREVYATKPDNANLVEGAFPTDETVVDPDELPF